MRLRKRRKYTFVLAILMFLLFGITIGYASIATGLLINGTADIEGTTWNVHFTQPTVLSGSTKVGTDDYPYQEVTIDDTSTLINYQVVFLKPGDYYEFTFDVVNEGQLDARIENVLENVGGKGNNDQYVSMEIIDTSTGESPKKNDVLRAGESRPLKMKITYKEDAPTLTGYSVKTVTYALDFIQFFD